MLNIILSGACGRMGAQVTALAESRNVKIVAGVDVNPRADMPFPVYPDFSMVQEKADAIIDFSRPEGLHALLNYATEKKLPVVLAATGYNENDLAAIREAAKEIAIFRSANMSLGVFVLKTLCARAAAMLPEYEIEIIEKHHNQKLDAPSGTAVMLYDAVANENSEAVHGRHGRTQKRQPQEIGMHAIRGGSVAGEHEVGFYGPGEYITLSHLAQDRSIFANGALRAAQFIAGQAPGEYDMGALVEGL